MYVSENCVKCVDKRNGEKKRSNIIHAFMWFWTEASLVAARWCILGHTLSFCVSTWDFLLSFFLLTHSFLKYVFTLVWILHYLWGFLLIILTLFNICCDELPCWYVCIWEKLIELSKAKLMLGIRPQIPASWIRDVKDLGKEQNRERRRKFKPFLSSIIKRCEMAGK